MLEVVVSGLITGWAIAVPVGAVAALLVALTARTSWRVGAAAAMGVATVDGVYAAAAVLGGAALASRLEPVTGTLRAVAAIVLLVLAALTVAHALRAAPDAPPTGVRRMGPGRAYVAFVGLTAINPATVVYFAAIVVGNRSLVEGGAERTVFVLAAFSASALWQLALAAAGVGLGSAVTGERGRLVTGVLSGVVIAGLAVWTLTG
ncbi:LysE family transporter [Nocardioides pacificus]